MRVRDVSAQPPVIDVSGLAKRFPNGTQALTEINFQVNAGETVVLLGANGSGKSTLQKCLTKLVEPTHGSVRVLDTEITTAGTREITALRRQVGVVFQRINLVRELSVMTNVIHGSLGRVGSPRNWFAGTARKDQREEAMEALDRVGLAHVAQRRADELSGGQQQRVAIARMLMQQPKVVLADEPVAALDPRAGRSVMDLLWEITEERGLTLLCTLHQLELARAYGRRVIALRDGAMDMDTVMSKVADEQFQGLYTTEDQEESPSHVTFEGAA
ncbi:phosphonate ABC transporter ATP-binding protein [Nesterenkonia sp. AN1]|uniref:Phosphonate transport system ATP-binding protein n=1 Tax=Nesterenkonia aurantiaca TaxID=1436010 RepID=A0A4R7G6C1_9MICC|nr:phosphonate ABC transporter ATP-binding protein [Nesterenkonia sp. AN1]TDS86887.1 phosphonate transport system ATP-binding protein [Nesterenkonia aurantiaca]